MGNEWKRPEGRLKEKNWNRLESAGKKREPLTGYHASEKERREKKEPQKTVDLESSYGTLSIGLDEKQRTAFLSSQKRGRELHAIPEQSKRLNSASAVQIPRMQGLARFRVNATQKEESAVEYQEGAERQDTPFLMRRMKSMMARTENRVQDHVLGFLDASGERVEAKRLRGLKKKVKDPRGKKEVDREIEALDAERREKTQRQLRLQKRVKLAKEEQRVQKKTASAGFPWQELLATFLTAATAATEEDGTADETKKKEKRANAAEKSGEKAQDTQKEGEK